MIESQLVPNSRGRFPRPLRSRLTGATVPSVLLVGGSAVAMGAGLALSSPLGLALLASAGVFAVAALGLRPLVIALIAATFVTRLRIPVVERNFLVEHLLLIPILLAAFFHGHLDRIVQAIRHPTVLLMGAFVLWSALTSLLHSPEPSESFAIVAWLTLDWVILLVLLAAFSQALDLERLGIKFAALTATVAVGLWLAAAAGITSFGVQEEPLTGASAAYGLSFEANLLAGTMAVWVFLALSSRVRPFPRMNTYLIVVGSLALMLALTRSAVISLGVAVAVWGVAGGARNFRRLLPWAALLAVGFVLALVLLPAATAPFTEKLGGAIELDEGTGANRVEDAKLALDDMTPQSWIVGLGTNSFGQRHFEATRPGKGEPGYLSALPLQVVYDTGVIGVLLIAAALLALRPWQLRDRARAAGVLIAFAGASLATSALWFGGTWMLIALALRAERTTGGTRTARARLRPRSSRLPAEDRPPAAAGAAAG